VVALNSSQPHWTPWNSWGTIPSPQLDALRAVLAEPWARDRFVFVMTHHAPRIASGLPDRVNHCLRNHAELLSICSRIERGAVLFGHVHLCYRLRLPELSVGLYNAGSATMLGLEGLWVFDLDGGNGRVTRGRWSGGRYVLDESESFDC
jgi:hypothetical protein